MMNSNAIIEYIVKGKKKKDFFFFLYYSNIPPIRLCSIKIRKEITFGFLNYHQWPRFQQPGSGVGLGRILAGGRSWIFVGQAYIKPHKRGIREIVSLPRNRKMTFKLGLYRLTSKISTTPKA